MSSCAVRKATALLPNTIRRGAHQAEITFSRAGNSGQVGEGEMICVELYHSDTTEVPDFKWSHPPSLHTILRTCVNIVAGICPGYI